MSARSAFKFNGFPTRPCHHCAGSGKEIDDVAFGAEIRRRRLARGLGLRQLASRLKVSAAYLSDLELGRRRWSIEKLGRIVEALR